MKYGKFPECGKETEPLSGINKNSRARDAFTPSLLMAAMAIALSSGNAQPITVPLSPTLPAAFHVPQRRIPQN